jgi:phage portal protein BeeE
VGLLERINARRAPVPGGPGGQKLFAEPPLWSPSELASWPSMSSATADRETIETSFEAYIDEAYKANPVVFAAIDRRQQVFSQARFQWQRWTNGRPQEMYGNAELALLERPWPNGTTGELLARMEVDASAAGNSYWTKVDDAGRIGRAARGPGLRVARMRPDWVTLIVGGPSDDPYALDARVLAYSFLPSPRAGYGSRGGGQREPVILMPDEVCHYSPKPNPTARFLGMSWMTPIIQDILGDEAATRHKLKFFQNGASPSLAVRFDKEVPPRDLDLFKQKFDEMHSGVDNAYRTLFMGGGADVTPLTVDLRQLDFKVTQGAGETRMAVVAGVPAVILGISEGLGGSSLNDGNFRAAKRLFVDGTIQDLWRKAAPSLEVLLTRPADGSQLVVDARDIPFLREDADNQAAIRAQDAQVIRTLGDGGWEPESILQFMVTSDPTRLVHTGRVPVQLQTPGAESPSSPNTPIGA